MKWLDSSISGGKSLGNDTNLLYFIWLFLLFLLIFILNILHSERLNSAGGKEFISTL